MNSSTFFRGFENKAVSTQHALSLQVKNSSSGEIGNYGHRPKERFPRGSGQHPIIPKPNLCSQPMICSDYIFIKETSFLIFRLNYLVQMNSSLNECHSKLIFLQVWVLWFSKYVLISEIKIRTLTHNLIFTDSLWISLNKYPGGLGVGEPARGHINRRISTSPYCLRHRLN